MGRSHHLLLIMSLGVPLMWLSLVERLGDERATVEAAR